MDPHRAEAGTTLPTHAEHLLLNFAVEEVSYGTLTAALGLVYADAVLVLGDVFGG